MEIRPPRSLRTVSVAYCWPVVCARTLIVMMLLAVAATPAAAQGGLICSDAADAIGTEFDAARSVAGAPLAVSVHPYYGRTAVVTDLAVSLGSGKTPVPMQPPVPGATSQATLRLPNIGGRVVLTFTWNQGPEPGLAEACSGRDTYELTVGPSAKQLRAYLGRVAAAQVIWNQRRKIYGRVLQQYQDGLDQAPHNAVGLFAYVRSGAHRALNGFSPARRLSARYQSKVRAARPPVGFERLNRDLARSAAVSDTATQAYFRALSQARTISDLTRANAAFKRSSGSKVSDIRRPWSEAIGDAAEEAGITPPAWALRIGE